MKKLIKVIYRLVFFLLNGRKCVAGKNTLLYSEAEIINNLRDKNRIKIGSYSHIRGQLLTYGHGGNIQIGNYCYVGRNTYIWSGKSILIGDRVLISHNCNIFDNDTHPIDAKARAKQFASIITKGQPRDVKLNDESVVIEDDVLIGANSIILKGVHIGKCSIIGAGSVVTKNIPPYVVVAGNPAKLVKTIKRQ